MTKILVAVDGSEPSLRAIDYAIKRAKAGGVDIYLLNVQPPLPQRVADAVSTAVVHDYHKDEANKALDPAEVRLTKAGVKYTTQFAVGTAGEVIAEHANEAGCDEIVMGARGLGAMLSLLLGSTTTRVLALANVPVILIK